MCRKPPNVALCLCSPGVAAYGYGYGPGATAFGSAGGAPHVPYRESLASIKVRCKQNDGRPYVHTASRVSLFPLSSLLGSPAANRVVADNLFCCDRLALSYCFSTLPPGIGTYARARAATPVRKSVHLANAQAEAGGYVSGRPRRRRRRRHRRRRWRLASGRDRVGLE